MFPGLTIVHTVTRDGLRGSAGNDDEGLAVLRQLRPAGNVAADDPRPPSPLVFKDGYEFGHTHLDAEIRGYDVAYRMVARRPIPTFIRCTLSVHGSCSAVGACQCGQRRAVDGLVGSTARSAGERDVLFAAADIRNTTSRCGCGNCFNRPDAADPDAMGYHIRPWHDGRNLDVYHWYQAPTFAMPPITAPNAYGDWPPGVYTMRATDRAGHADLRPRRCRPTRRRSAINGSSPRRCPDA